MLRSSTGKRHLCKAAARREIHDVAYAHNYCARGRFVRGRCRLCPAAACSACRASRADPTSTPSPIKCRLRRPMARPLQWNGRRRRSRPRSPRPISVAGRSTLLRSIPMAISLPLAACTATRFNRHFATQGADRRAAPTPDPCIRGRRYKSRFELSVDAG